MKRPARYLALAALPLLAAAIMIVKAPTTVKADGAIVNNQNSCEYFPYTGEGNEVLTPSGEWKLSCHLTGPPVDSTQHISGIGCGGSLGGGIGEVVINPSGHAEVSCHGVQF